jgi:hypothetical protein
MSAYSVTAPTPVCAATGEPIEPGAPCVSLLYEVDEDALVRRDVAADAWDTGAARRRPSRARRDRVAPPRLVAQWRTTMREKDAPKKMLIGDDEVIDLFEQLGDADGDDQLAFRYLLCLILIRKKQLVWEGARPATADAGGGRARPPTRRQGGPDDRGARPRAQRRVDRGRHRPARRRDEPRRVTRPRRGATLSNRTDRGCP